MYFFVAPRWTRRSADEKLQPAAAAERYSSTSSAPSTRGVGVSGHDRRCAGPPTASARVTLMGVSTGRSGVSGDPALGFRGRGRRRPHFAVALRAARTGRCDGLGSSAQGLVGQAALPLFFDPPGASRGVGNVVVFSAPLTDVGGNVALIRSGSCSRARSPSSWPSWPAG